LSRGRYKISTCHPKEEKEAPDSKYEFYYIILSISIVCLSATLLIYGIFKDALLRSEYNKIMINFAASLLLAFLTLVVMNTLDGSKMTKTLCTGFTIINQFALLSAFTLMTIMSYDIFKQIHGMTVINSKKRETWKHILIAYSISGSISLLTLIVELAAPKCSKMRPKFGMRNCHFYGKLDKFVWLYLPILILLLINSFMFVYILRNIIQNSKSETSGKDGRKERVDKMCLYLRLFLGMGIIWYFEILAFALGWFDIGVEWFYFTDMINMLQGVWVFIIFVCKRNVMKVVMRKKDRLYSIVARTIATTGNQGKARAELGLGSQQDGEHESVPGVPRDRYHGTNSTIVSNDSQDYSHKAESVL